MSKEILCPKCGSKIEDKDLINACSNCKTNILDYYKDVLKAANSINENLEKVKKIKFLLTDYEVLIDSAIGKKVWEHIGILGLVLALIGISGFIELREFVKGQLATRNIQLLVKETAEKYTNDAISQEVKQRTDDSIKPIRDSLVKDETDVKETKNEMDEIKKRSESELDKFAEQLGVLEKRNELTSLANVVILKGEVKKFEELNSLVVDKDLEDVKTTEILRVKSFYISASRIGGIDVMVTTDGKTLKNELISTVTLIEGLTDASVVWQYRAKIAQLLGNRREKGVPEALLKTLSRDPQLDVRKEALQAFENITGFIPRDIFGWDEATSWWDKNKVDKEKELSDLKK